MAIVFLALLFLGFVVDGLVKDHEAAVKRRQREALKGRPRGKSTRRH